MYHAAHCLRRRLGPRFPFTSAFLNAQLAAERRRSGQLVDDLKRAKEENFLAVIGQMGS